MARPVTIEETALLTRLSDVFRDLGYEGASLAMLAEAAGLKKASLYHRFPGGKEEMAGEVMARAEAWLSEHILRPLATPGSPQVRIDAMLRRIDAFYSGGRQSCLLNMMSSPRGDWGPFAPRIAQALKAWIEALAAVLVAAGVERVAARLRAERAVALVQGSLVLSRGLGSSRPFRHCLDHLSRDLVPPAGSGTAPAGEAAAGGG